MSTDVPQITADFVPLTPEQAERYEEIKEIISGIAHKEDGLMFLLNAVALTSSTALTTMHMWAGLLPEGWQPNDLVGIIYERPMELPRFAD